MNRKTPVNSSAELRICFFKLQNIDADTFNLLDWNAVDTGNILRLSGVDSSELFRYDRVCGLECHRYREYPKASRVVQGTYRIPYILWIGVVDTRNIPEPLE